MFYTLQLNYYSAFWHARFLIYLSGKNISSIFWIMIQTGTIFVFFTIIGL